MEISVRKYGDRDIAEMIEIWNRVVRDGVAFPQENPWKRKIRITLNRLNLRFRF